MGSQDPRRAELLAAYDAQLRADAEVVHARRVERVGPLLRSVQRWGGFVTYRDLGGLEGDALDEMIADTVAWFRDGTDVDTFEWKTRGHDAPADLPDRLVAHGLVAEPRETVMVGEASALAVDVALPPEVVVRQAGVGRDLRDDLDRGHTMQESVFGRGRGPATDDVLHRHVPSHPGAVGAGRGHHDHAVRLDPLTPVRRATGEGPGGREYPRS
jgi:hypothetical protein